MSVVVLMESIPERALQRRSTNCSHRPSEAQHLCTFGPQRIIFTFLKIQEEHVNRDSTWPAKPKVFMTDPLQEKFADP